MKSLIIHVGPHKTGTTSIQEYLLHQAPAIKELGTEVFLEYTSKDRARANAWALAHCFVREELQTPMRMSARLNRPGSSACEQTITSFRDWVNASSAQTFILSSETFSFLRTEEEADRLAAALGGLFEHVVPIMTYRPIEQRRRSWKHQLLEMDVEKRLSDLADSERVDQDWYFDWESLKKFWSRFGDVVVIDYQKAVHEYGSIIPEFQRAMELQTQIPDTDYFLNVSEKSRLRLARRFRSQIVRLLGL